MEVKQLVAFVTIAQNKSFTKAAEKLGYSQSAITIQIKQLEEELQVKLFDRIGKKTLLTPHGNEFIKYAVRILDEINRSKHTLTMGELNHQVHIGTVESLCNTRLYPVLIKLHDLYPDIKVKITIDSPENLIHMMEQGELDMIYVLERPLYRGRWAKVYEKKEEIVFVCRMDLPITQIQNLKFDDLLDYKLILTEKNANYRFAFDQFLAEKKMNIHPFLEVSDTQFIIKMLCMTDCISLLPYYTVEEYINNNKLTILNIQEFDTTIYSQIIYHKDKWVTREMKEVVRLLSEEI